MTHEELLQKVNATGFMYNDIKHKWQLNFEDVKKGNSALLAIINLHSPEGKPDQQCRNCKRFYPCHTIQAIIKELQ